MSLDAERHLIGAILGGYRGITDLEVSPEDFASEKHGDIWTACLRIHESGAQPDGELVKDRLGPDTLSMLDGGVLYLFELAHNCPSPLSAPEYARIVIESAIRRRLKGAGDQVLHIAELPGDIADLHEQARAVVDDAAPRASRRKLRMLGDILPDVLDLAERGEAAGLPTPWVDLNRLIVGLRPGSLYVVGARPSYGKSVIGANLALEAARKGRGAYIASIEMSETEVAQRILADDASVDLSALIHARLSDRDWERVRDKFADLSRAPIAVEDAARQTIGSIRAAVRDAKRLMDLAVVVVDYAQLVTSRDPRLSREQQVAEVSRGLKLIAREQGVAVVAMAQLNRAPTATNRRPTIADIRESGAVEADADVVMLLHREDDNPEGLELIVAKNRSGPTGTVDLLLQGYYARVVSSYRPGDHA